MEFCTEKRKPENSSSVHIATGLILELGCFAAVLTDGILVGQTMGDALITLQMIASVEVASLG